MSWTVNLLSIFIVNHFLFLDLEFLDVFARARVFLLLLLAQDLLRDEHLNVLLAIEDEHVQVLVEYLDALPILVQIPNVLLLDDIWIRCKNAILPDIFTWVVQFCITLSVAEFQSRIGGIETFSTSLLSVFSIVLEVVFIPLMLRVFTAIIDAWNH